ncbi:MAG: hypothetical protein EA350_12915 [Gemmatimonadales bacterium]|nr:MAG: hypothetical protein EA350_12915 [Gemmatimonadales bacterium]
MTEEDFMTMPRARSLPRAVAVPILGLVLLALLAGCGLREGATDDPFRGQERSGTVTLEIRNDNFNDARIYTLWNGERQRIGTVTGISERSFDIDFRGGDLRVHVDFLAAGEFTSERILVSPGDTVSLVIPSRP